jgi:carboxyl-terminal processing protease
MSETVKRILTAGACMIMGCSLGVVITVTGFGQKIGSSDTAQVGADKYTEIMDLVDQYFIGDDVDLTAVNDAMASGVISGLGDRWSYYVSAEDYQSYLENINNAYVGVGITISAQYDEDGNLLGYGVSDVTQGGPAEAAGVLAGDVLIQVDDVSVRDITLTETKNMVKGQEGTTVDLTFLRDGETITFTVERQSLTLVPATGQLLDGSIGYIAIDNFDAGCAETVESLIEELQAQGAQALVFDVRNNPGGLKRELTDLLDYLLPEGIVFHTVNYAGEEEIVMSDSSCVDLPMAVLVNGDSYSAAEYFACALQEYGVGTVVGEKTCGKGYYQVGLTLSDGSCINLSIGKYYTPNGESLIDVGVTPDIELELSDEDAAKLARNTLEPQEDPQLQAAIQSVMP